MIGAGLSLPEPCRLFELPEPEKSHIQHALFASSPQETGLRAGLAVFPNGALRGPCSGQFREPSASLRACNMASLA
ncbi:hypothetical protein CD351_07420 [Erythrobacter sp. KY5]|nr:hypothetical protein CD351_07420 [Erythrobacter sp. KY5]